MKKIFLKIIVVAVIVFVFGAIVYFYSNKKSNRSDAKQQEEITMKIGDREGSFLLQKINSDSVEGLWFQIYPVARVNDAGEPKTLRAGNNIGYLCEGISEKLSEINFTDQTAIFIKTISEPPYGGCPI